MTLKGRTVLITGGESGIGRASASLFIEHGARVHLVGLREPELEVAVKELGSERACASVADVSDEDAVRAAVEAGVARYGGYDVVFSNAGISGDVAPLEEYSSATFEHTLKVHVLGAFHVLKHASPHLRDGGSIIITSSVVGLIGFAGLPAYVAAKHGQVGLMRAAAKELAPRRIRVNTLHPGPTSTAFQDDIEMRATGADQASAAATFDDLIPLGRHNTVEEVAQAALYLASDASSMVTASTFAIDGGMSG